MNTTIVKSHIQVVGGLIPHLTCNTWAVLYFFSKHNNSLSNERLRQSKLANLPPQAMKHLWIRTALMEKLLDKIVLYLVENSRLIIKYLLLNITQNSWNSNRWQRGQWVMSKSRSASSQRLFSAVFFMRKKPC